MSLQSRDHTRLESCREVTCITRSTSYSRVTPKCCPSTPRFNPQSLTLAIAGRSRSTLLKERLLLFYAPWYSLVRSDLVSECDLEFWHHHFNCTDCYSHGGRRYKRLGISRMRQRNDTTSSFGCFIQQQYRDDC